MVAGPVVLCTGNVSGVVQQNWTHICRRIRGQISATMFVIFGMIIPANAKRCGGDAWYKINRLTRLSMSYAMELIVDGSARSIAFSTLSRIRL